MGITSKIVSIFFHNRMAAIDRFRQNPHEVQLEQFHYLCEQGAHSRFGEDHGIHAGMTYGEFAQNVPVSDYEELSEQIFQAKRGEPDILWPGMVKWFAKSSGTTGGRSKYIPVTETALKDNHFRGPRDVIALFSSLYPESNVYSGKTLTLGGSKRIEEEGDSAFSGDLSAILIENTPPWANLRRVPSAETALIPDFEQKVEAICRETLNENVASFAGVPSWNLVMLNKILEITGKDNILEIWPNMELFIHGGVNFEPYREQYRRIIPSDNMKYMETYNASEGFFAVADRIGADDMLLMLDYRTFYEFIPLERLEEKKAVPLSEVREGVNYAMVITSSNGLWRYMLGDTVIFTSTAPYRIKITGRTKHYINAFGEEVIVDNAEKALREACEITGAQVSEYTVAPVYMDGKARGAHQWIIEFAAPPDSIDKFTVSLDTALRGINSDYDAKRFKDTTLLPPQVTVLPQGTFLRWMESRGKVGGQNKVPRLYNDRTYAEQLLAC